MPSVPGHYRSRFRHGPDLTGLRLKEWLTAFLSNPAAVSDGTGKDNDRMPRLLPPILSIP